MSDTLALNDGNTVVSKIFSDPSQAVLGMPLSVGRSECMSCVMKRVLRLQRESNARFVKWSDGTWQLMIGTEVLNMQKQSMAGDQAQLFVKHPRVRATDPSLSTYSESLTASALEQVPACSKLFLVCKAYSFPRSRVALTRFEIRRLAAMFPTWPGANLSGLPKKAKIAMLMDVKSDESAHPAVQSKPCETDLLRSRGIPQLKLSSRVSQRGTSPSRMLDSCRDGTSENWLSFASGTHFPIFNSQFLNCSSA